MKKIGALICVVCCLLCTACQTNGADQELSVSFLPEGTTQNEVQNTAYVEYAESDTHILSINPDTTGICVTDKRDAYSWFSQPENAGIDQMAPVSIRYYDTGEIKTMNTMTDSVLRGQYRITAITNGVQVEYTLGELAADVLLPHAMSVERYQSIVNNIADDFDLAKLEAAYAYVDPTTYGDAQKLAEWMKAYPRLAESPLYILWNPDMPNTQKKEYAAILEAAGYTAEHYEEDRTYYNGQADATKKAVFRLVIRYSLDGDKMKAEIPMDELQMEKEFPLLSIEVLKYFGSPSLMESGYFLLPDGSGSLMNFYNGKDGLTPYSIPVYGRDNSIRQMEDVYALDQAYLPVYGIKREAHAVLAFAENGDAVADIKAYTGSDVLPAYAFFNFQVRESYESVLNVINNKKGFLIIQDTPLSGSVSVEFTFLSDAEADYNGMAARLKQKLFSDKQKLETGVPITVADFVCMGTQKANFLGISYDKKTVFSTFEQVAEKARLLKERQIAALSVRLTGWFGDGVFHKNAASAIPETALGSQKGFQSLIENMAEEGILVYPDADILYTYKDAWLDGFSAKKDSTRTITNAIGYVSRYNPATFAMDDALIGKKYIHNAKTVEQTFNGYEKALGAYGLTAMSLGTLASDLNADYNEDSPLTRQEMADLLSRLCGHTDMNMMAEGANAFILPYMDICLNVPHVSNRMDCTDETIPFLQMVMSGYVQYCGFPLNAEGNTKEAVLRSSSVAAGLNFVLSAQNAEEFRSVEPFDMYSTDFDFWLDKVVEITGEYQKKLAEYGGREIIRYEKLQEGVYKTVFEGGLYVIVNYTESTVRLASELIPAESYVTGRMAL